MRRLAVVLSVLCLTVVGTGVLTSATAGAVPGKTSVFVANAFSYAGGHPFDGTFCVNGDLVGDPATEEVQGPTIVDSGAVTAQFWDSNVEGCDANDPTATFEGTLPDEGTVTFMAYWGDTGQALAMLDNPLDCVDAGNGRLTVRNGSGFGDPSDVDIYGDGPGGTGQLLLEGIESGDQGTADLPVGTYSNVVAVPAGGDSTDVVTEIGSIDVLANSGAYAYIYGGNDGDVGSFLSNPDELNGCTAPTTTTAPATTTTAAAKPADAVATAPAFTG